MLNVLPHYLVKYLVPLLLMVVSEAGFLRTS